MLENNRRKRSDARDGVRSPGANGYKVPRFPSLHVVGEGEGGGAFHVAAEEELIQTKKGSDGV